MRGVRLLLRDRRRRQRGSVLSALLIIVALLSILIGALMTEVTSSFLLSRALVTRVTREATVTSAVEFGIYQLQNSSVPAICVRDSRGPWFLTLNGSPASVTQTCSGIVPDLVTGLAAGAFAVDGTHDKTSGRNRYLLVDSSGRVYAYPFGQTTAAWSVATGGAATAPPVSIADPSHFPDVSLLVPIAKTGSGCSAHCVATYGDSGGTPRFRCAMPAVATVTGRPAAETTVGGSPNFPGYAFFGDSAGNLYVYDATSGGGCNRLEARDAGGAIVGSPLVFTGDVSGRAGNRTTSDDIFVVVANGNATSLQHWTYTETEDDHGNFNGNGNTTTDLNQVGKSLNLNIGGSATGYAISSLVPTVGSTLNMAVAGASGKLQIARIAVHSGPSYSTSTGPSFTLPGTLSRPPSWCHCPGQDLIGVGSTNGSLYLLSPALALQVSYDGVADGRPAINTTPSADANGDWYFGADDGYVYDVELPASGPKMFKAARLGPGGSIRSSPLVGGVGDGCGSGPCLYFASSTLGAYFARLGNTRVIELRACLSTASHSTTCAAVNPRLWARVEVGSPAVVGARGVLVQGWSYYSP
jgi:hypothetical protein